jgi:hypothetical protein
LSSKNKSIYENGNTTKINENKLNDILADLFNNNFKSFDITTGLNDHFTGKMQHKPVNDSRKKADNQTLDNNNFKTFLIENYPLHMYYSQVIVRT